MSQSRSVKLVIEGAEAAVATRDLFGAGWFEGEWAEQGGPGSSKVTAQVIALASGSVTTADKLIDWWAKWRRAGAGAGAPLSVELEASGVVVLMENATRDALVGVLRTLHAPRRG
jgi:hypothetical protein